MTIERMEHVAVLVPSSRSEALVEWLYGRRAIHLEPFSETPEGWDERFGSIEEDASRADEEMSRLQEISSFLTPYRDDQGGFLESIFPVRVLASLGDIQEAAGETDTAALQRETASLASQIDSAREELENAEAQRDRLEELSFLDVEPRALEELRRLSVRFVATTGELSKAFLNDERLSGLIAAERVAESGKSQIYLLVGPSTEAAAMKSLVSDYGLREIWLPEIKGTVAEELKRLAQARAAAAADLKDLAEKARRLAQAKARDVDLALAHWEAERARITEQSHMQTSPNVFAARGYVRRKDLAAFGKDLEAAFPDASLIAVPPVKDEDPPVSVAWGKFFRPAGLLVRMFGLPLYRSLDPTVFLTLTFLAFFGICFGDVVYGTMLIGISIYLMRRYRQQKGLVIFFRLFTYAGFATMFVGFLTGSWAADLPAYFGETNPVNVLRLRIAVLDPLAKPMIALGIAIGIGVVNQLYGIFVRFLQEARRGDWADGIFDGLFWIGYLASLLTVALSGVGVFPFLFKPALVIFAASALGLILTQGRDQKSWIGRIIAGVVSLYGITGNYGTTAFVGDVVSYSRLLALALTTFVVGMTFNIIADLLKSVPYVGWVLFIGFAVCGHLFNFTISILGAFVHSARLILLEWFGRFYESGGREFRPFGFKSNNVEVLSD